jgi:Protein of unknown function (DUF2950)
MKIQHKMSARPGHFAIAVLATAVLALAGCAKKAETVAGFQTPEAAVAALVDALQKNDLAAAGKVLGADTADLLNSGDAVADAADRADFLASLAAKNSIAVDGDTATLLVGENDWPLPIPLVKRDGSWSFDGDAGIDEMIYRRVGANELGAIDVMYGYVNAQNAYAAEGRDGDPPGIYALKLVSDAGLHNGLYWPTAEGEPASPAGPFMAAAAEEGYAALTSGRTPYHGYFYRMLYAQGANANGGAREYFKDGVLTEGFAAIAWPADYGASGVMTFIINQDGVVFQKDLGEDTATVVETIKAFDPDSSWTAIVPPDAESAAAAE